MANKLNKIEGVGLDCSTLQYHPSPDYLPDFLYIDTSSNNLSVLEGLTEGKSLIVRVGTGGTGLKYILEGLEIKTIDVLLLPASSSINPEILKEILTEFGVKSVGIDRPESLTQCREAAEQIKQVILPTYLSLDICPLHFQKDLIEWADEEGLDILGFNPFGGFLSAPSLIQSFSIPFLLTFSAAYSKIVFLSGRDISNANNNAEYLRELIEKERLDCIRMNKNVDRLIKPLPKMVYTGLKTEDDGIIPYINPELLNDPSEIILSLEPIEGKTGEIKEDDVIKEILDFDLLTLPLSEVDQKTAISIILPSILKTMKARVVKLGDTTFLIRIEKEKREKRYLWKDKVWRETIHYILSLEGGEIKINKVK